MNLPTILNLQRNEANIAYQICLSVITYTSKGCDSRKNTFLPQAKAANHHALPIISKATSLTKPPASSSLGYTYHTPGSPSKGSPPKAYEL